MAAWMTCRSLQQTIDGVMAGRTELYESIVRYYEGFVFSVAVRVTFDRDLAYDVTQETFLKLYKTLSRFRGQSRLSSYLYRIATNAGIDAARKRAQHPVSSGDAQADLLTVEAPQTANDGPDAEEVKCGCSSRSAEGRSCVQSGLCTCRSGWPELRRGGSPARSTGGDREKQGLPCSR